eukprot:TRINITY_DN15010_c0_g1_i1.p1 TRINITY_DN15010_c0_g1~~TRINITY_DN15010_c0_g1_i1.p1  ORF type:complete len:730 (-),score=147.21 TRINITY_DN15010_c0_g1_i1:118-2307(-)
MMRVADDDDVEMQAMQASPTEEKRHDLWSARQPPSSNRIMFITIGAVSFVLFAMLVWQLSLSKSMQSTLDSIVSANNGGSSAFDDALGREVLAVMDPNTSPCDDFFQFACGGWLARTSIPSDRSGWTRSFSEIDERNERILKSIVTDNWPMISTYYSNCMNEAAINAQGFAPLEPLLADVENTLVSAVLATAGKLQAASVGVFFDIYVDADARNPTTDILQLQQGGLGLPDRDYYLSMDADMVDIRSAYVNFIATMLTLLDSSADPAYVRAEAFDILRVETLLANASWTRTEMRNPQATYNRLDLSGLQALTPYIDWPQFFMALGFPQLIAINVVTPSFFLGLQELLTANGGLISLKRYMKWHVVRTYSPDLSAAFVNASFEFYGKRLDGTAELSPRWRRCLNKVDEGLPEVLGRYFVQEAFSGNSKTVALDMINRIEAAFARDLNTLSWMDQPTRAAALVKIAKITNKIGYPDRWTDYSSLYIQSGQYFANVLAVRQFATSTTLARVGQPVNKGLWLMSPPTVNAYYNPPLNEMVFPAGIMQRPFFNVSYPVAMLYGGMGMVMGHELTHGFDDQGRQYDGDGRLVDWWSAAASAAFQQRAQCVVNQYNNFQVLPGVHVNGELTLGENIADMGGIKDAYVAYQRYVQDNGAEPQLVSQYSNNQLLFISFAQGWCSKRTAESERVRVATDPHSPPKFRVNGPLQNLPAFAQEFSCPVGSRMRPASVCEIW